MEILIISKINLKGITQIETATVKKGGGREGDKILGLVMRGVAMLR
jgi:hypothetical protein